MIKYTSVLTDFRNESGLKFTDISTEEFREYSFGYRIDHPLWLHVSGSGGHRIFNGEHCYYVQPEKGWAISWLVRDGEPHFVL